MEFSFDRSRNQTGAQTPPRTDSNKAQDFTEQDPSTMANERLKKAIERNRAKQLAREAQANQSSQDFANAPKREEAQFRAPPPPPMPDFEPIVETKKPKTSIVSRKASTVVTRRSVAKADDTEFVPVKRTQRKVASQVKYTTSSTRKKVKTVNPKFHNWVSKGCWAFCLIMIGRLIFANGGVTDYYSQKRVANTKESEYERIKKDNSSLIKEIDRMRSDTGYQKKLVRDHLGFIAKDEYLVLFPKEK